MPTLTPTPVPSIAPTDHDELEALIREARARQRRRRLGFAASGALLAAAGVLVSSAISGSPFALGTRASGGVLCASPPSGWKQRESRLPGTPATLSLTNFRFGRAAYLDGNTDPQLHWPNGGILITIIDWSSSATPAMRKKFRPVAAAPPLRQHDFSSFEGVPLLGREQVRLDTRLLEIWVQARPTDAATIAAANRALSDVRVCAA